MPHETGTTSASDTSTDIATPRRTGLIMTGGFLGACKTTLLLRLGKWLSDRDLRVGLVTNDQAAAAMVAGKVAGDDAAIESGSARPGNSGTPLSLPTGQTLLVQRFRQLPAAAERHIRSNATGPRVTDVPHASTDQGSSAEPTPRILSCRCAHAQVVPPEVKQEVLAGLAANGRGFEAVADLCEMAARCNPQLKSLTADDRPL